MHTDRKVRPRIKLKPGATDIILEKLALACLISVFLMPAIYYQQLPESIPRHFDGEGLPDGYSHKSIIWLFSVIGAAMYIGLKWLSSYPHIFNYPVKITEQNAERCYKLGVRMIRIMNLSISGMMAYIIYVTLHIALGHQQSLGQYFLPLILMLLLSTCIYFIYQMSNAE
jgi:uncharacterized membrane protein